MPLPPFFDIPDEHALRIGRLVARWSAIEFVLEGIIWDMARFTPEEGRLFTSRLDARPKWELITNLIKSRAHLAESLAAWMPIVKEVEAVKVQRDSYLHSTWFIHPEGVGSLAFHMNFRKAKAGAEPLIVTHVRLEDIDQIRERSDLLLERLLDFAPQLAPPSSRNTPEQLSPRHSNHDPDQTGQALPPQSSGG